MNIDKFKPLPSLLIVKKPVTESKTESGFEVEENSDDFLVWAEIIKSGSPEYKSGEAIVFHALYTDEFRDGSDSYFLVHEDDIVGHYSI